MSDGNYGGYYRIDTIGHVHAIPSERGRYGRTMCGQYIHEPNYRGEKLLRAHEVHATCKRCINGINAAERRATR
jgi:hypothetical protein